MMRRRIAAVVPLVACTLLSTSAVVRAESHAQSPEITVSAMNLDQYAPAVAYNSKRGEFLVVWHNNWPTSPRDVWGKRIDRYGNVISEFVIAEDVSRDRAQPAAAYDPIHDRYLVTWVGDVWGDDSDWDVYGRVIPWYGPNPELIEFPICTWTAKQWTPKVAYAGTPGEFLVVWNDEGDVFPWYVSARRINAATGAPIGAAASIIYGRSPDVAYNLASNKYLVVFEQTHGPPWTDDIYAVKINAGTVISGGGDYAIAGWPDDEKKPAVAASALSNKWLVVWQSDTGNALKDVYARFVNGDGSIDGAPIHFARTALDEREPDVACDPESSTFLVTWEQQYANTSGPFGIFAQTLDSQHHLGTDFPVRGISIGESVTTSNPAIAASEPGWFIAWEHLRNGTTFLDIHGRVVFEVFADGFEGGTAAWSNTVP